MKNKEKSIGFPREFSLFIPSFNENEKEILALYSNNYLWEDSLIKVRDLLVDLIPSISQPSEALFYSFGKILFNISDFETLLSFESQYNSIGLELWKIRVLLERGMSDEAIRLASIIKEKENIPLFFRFHAIRSIANGYLNLGNYEQCNLNLQILFGDTYPAHKTSKEEKLIINDILLDAHRDSFFINRYIEEKIKLENKLNLAAHIAEELGERNHIAEFNYLLALLLRDAGKIEDSKFYTNKAIELLESTGNKSLLAAAKGNIGTINVILGKLDQAENIFLEILNIFRSLEENRYVALTIKSLGDILIEKGEFNEAILKYEQALQITEKLNLKETYHYCILAELYLYSNDIQKFRIVLNTLEEDIRNNPSPIIRAYILFLKGIENMKNINYGKADEELREALEIADRQGRGELSAKILMNLILLKIGRFDAEKNSKDLTVALNLLTQLLPYFMENQLHKEQVVLRVLESKIFAILGDLSKSFNSLQKAKDLVNIRKNKSLFQMIEKRIDGINKLIIRKEHSVNGWINEPFRTDISALKEIGLKYTQRSYLEQDIAPLALIVLHRSGIPLRSFVIHKKAVKDQLLFGGFIVAIKDMLSELFQEQKSQMLVITYGNHKIIIEAHPLGFSSVAVSARDSFSLRRKIHQLTNLLSNYDIPRQFHGEIEEKLAKAIDENVNLLFGSKLVYSDAITLDL